MPLKAGSSPYRRLRSDSPGNANGPVYLPLVACKGRWMGPFCVFSRVDDARGDRCIGAEGGCRTHTPFRAADFKSAASTIPPPRPERIACSYSSVGVVGGAMRRVEIPWRRRAESNRRIRVLQTLALTTWLRRLVDLVPRAGLEPTRVAPRPPQDRVSTSSTTWAGLQANRTSVGFGSIAILPLQGRPCQCATAWRAAFSRVALTTP